MLGDEPVSSMRGRNCRQVRSSYSHFTMLRMDFAQHHVKILIVPGFHSSSAQSTWYMPNTDRTMDRIFSEFPVMTRSVHPSTQ